MAWSLRAAEPADAEALIATLIEAFEGYRAFAPPTWNPPDEGRQLERFRGEIEDPDAFTLLAEGAGHVHWVPLGDPVDIHLRHLFVRPAYWGTGLARELHAAAVEAMRGRSARLFTPAGHGRARRFYEREGWTLHAELEDEHFGMPLAEYRR
ncbi:MAG: diamine N-acetyltransferase [Solirubrobacteraceae bacterium]|nr:diamine N-acetyltransferase [Solirubrobacteraceae bacterium]